MYIISKSDSCLTVKQNLSFIQMEMESTISPDYVSINGIRLTFTGYNLSYIKWASEFISVVNYIFHNYNDFYKEFKNDESIKYIATFKPELKLKKMNHS
jgi:hypothetical protein